MRHNDGSYRLFFLTMIILLCGSFGIALAEPWDCENNYGTISQIRVNENRIYFNLQNGKTDMAPKNGIYYVNKGNEQYNIMVDMIVRAAQNHWVIKVCTTRALDIDSYARVSQVILDIK